MPGALAEAVTPARPADFPGGAGHSRSEVASVGRPLSHGGAARSLGASHATSGELAYTGAELALPVLVALLALGTGLGLTVASRRRLAGAVL